MIADPKPPRRRPRYVGFVARVFYDTILAFLFIYLIGSLFFAVDRLIHH